MNKKCNVCMIASIMQKNDVNMKNQCGHWSSWIWNNSLSICPNTHPFFPFSLFGLWFSKEPMLIVGCCFNVDFVGLVRTSCGDYDLSLIGASPHLYPPINVENAIKTIIAYC